MSSPEETAEETPLGTFSHQKLWRVGLIVVGVLALIGVVLALGWHKDVSLESLISHRATLAALVAGHPKAALASYVVLYTLAAGLALPGVIFLTIGGGALFGGLVGGVGAMIGATTGATAVFLIGRTWLRRIAMRWLGPQVHRFADDFRAGAFNYLLFMRLVPIFPFTLGNLLPALCGVRLRTFVSATFVGIGPMTLAIAFFGDGIDSALGTEIGRYQACRAAGTAGCHLNFSIWNVVTPQFIAGLVALGVAVLLPALLRRRRQQRDLAAGN